MDIEFLNPKSFTVEPHYNETKNLSMQWVKRTKNVHSRELSC